MNSWLPDYNFFFLLFCEGNKYDTTIGLHGPIGWPKSNKKYIVPNAFVVLFHFQFGSDAKASDPWSPHQFPL